MPNNNETHEQSLQRLRETALALINQGVAPIDVRYSTEELVHELQVMHVELEMQNESLRMTQAELEESRDRYVDLYDFAPVGYLSVNEAGLICEANLTACQLLRLERSKLLHRRFAQFIAAEEGEQWHERFQNSWRQAEQVSFEVLLMRSDGSLFHAALNGRRVTDGVRRMLRLTLADVSKRVADRREVAVHRDHLEHLIAIRTAQLNASEDKVSGLLGQSLAGVYILQDGLVRYANQMFAEIFGYASPADLVDRLHFSELIAAADSSRIEEFAGGQKYEESRYCFVGLRRDGSPVHLEAHSRKIEHLGQPALLGIILDISARKRAAEERQEIESWLRGITDHAAAIISLKNPDGRYLYVNRRFEQVFHMKRAAVRGKTDCELFPKEIAERFTASDRAALRSRRSYETEEPIRHKDGMHTYLTVKFPLTNAAGGIYAVGAISTDITEHKRAQLKSTQFQRRVELLMKHSKECIMIFNAEGRIAEVSEGCTLAYGYTREEMLTMKAAHLQAPETHDDADVQFRRLIAEGSVLYETVHWRKDGTRFPVEVGATTIGSGSDSFAQVIIRDISERVRERTELEQDLARYSHRLDLALRRVLEVQEQAKRRLSSELHDRTSPNLAAIGLNLSLLGALCSKQLPESNHYLEDLRALVNDTETSIREICAELRPAVLDYAGLQAALSAYVGQFAKRTGIAAKLECDCSEARLAPDVESLLFRICQEALTNCLKHAHAKAVTITLRCVEEPVTMIIADDGGGFDVERMQNDGGITGLGLLSMREMTEISGGHFKVESRPGSGTRIEVRI